MIDLTRIPENEPNESWTDDQRKAIYATGSDLLVAAAAGSGKTAVLVRRIIKKVLDKENPIDIDRLLVLTFTKAAAAEMRTRISEALEQELENQEDPSYIRRQISLMNKAQISTLDSFCMEIVRSHFYKLGIDPTFKIAADTDTTLLLEEAIEKLFESEYAKEDHSAFIRAVDSFSSDRSDAQFAAILVDVYKASQSHPSPMKWLNQLAVPYKEAVTSEMEMLNVYSIMKQDISFYLDAALDRLYAAKQVAENGEGLEALVDVLNQDIQRITELSSVLKQSWKQATDIMRSEIFRRAPSIRASSCDVNAKEKAASLRNDAKKYVEAIQKMYFERDAEGYIEDIQAMGSVVETISDLVKKLHFLYLEEKLSKNMVDFNDLEHMAIEILTCEEEDGFKSSEIALGYQNYFSEVLVDEYQDTNRVQETIIQAIKKPTEKDGNLFMVGDIKQSIYRFRLADPSLFREKHERFGKENESGSVIDLNANFRSRKEVLDGTNYIFKQLMNKEVGEIDYDEKAELYFRADYYPEIDVPIEFHLLDRSLKELEQSAQNGDGELDFEGELEDLSAAQFEAKMMGLRIQQMMQEGYMVYDKSLKCNRNMEYRDIVILHRSKSWYGEITEALNSLGIPVYAQLGNGYFETIEISVMLSLLKIIDNPYQDIPLAAVLRSPLVGLSSNELAEIRLTKRNVPFYESLKKYNEQGLKREEAGNKVKLFFKRLDKWVRFSKNNPVSSLIWEIYRETNYLEFVLTLPRGSQRQANLLGLYNRATDFEKGSNQGIFRFLRFVERLLEKGEDFGEVSNIGEQENVVRVMTIHASKGLEFPVVFVGGLAKEFNRMDLNTTYITDKDFGLAVKFVDTENRLQRDTIMRSSFVNKKKLELISEEMRLLYVALTRAKEKLILFATVKNAEMSIQKWSVANHQSDWLLSNSNRALCTNYADWIGPALIRHTSMQEFVQEHFPNLYEEWNKGNENIKNHPSKWSISLTKMVDTQVPVANEARSEDAKQLAEQFQYEQSIKTENDEILERIQHLDRIPHESEYKEAILQRMNWSYEFKRSTQHKAKQSVTEIKKLAHEEDENTSEELKPKIFFSQLSMPKSKQESQIGAAERGTIMHLVMQHIDLSREVSIETISEKLNELVRLEFMTSQQQKAVDVRGIFDFFQSDIGKKIHGAEKVWRETPFSLMLPTKEVYSDWTGAEEKILVQGVIDCMFEDEQGTIVLVDYKTDRIKGVFKGGFEEAKAELKKRYQKQIDLYTKAIEDITHKKVSRKILYLFDVGHELEM